MAASDDEFVASLATAFDDATREVETAEIETAIISDKTEEVRTYLLNDLLFKSRATSLFARALFIYASTEKALAVASDEVTSDKPVRECPCAKKMLRANEISNNFFDEVLFLRLAKKLALAEK